MKYLSKTKVASVFLMIVMIIMGTYVFADGSAYFDVVSVEGVPCYIVPEALDEMQVSDDTVFFLPVAISEGYEAVFTTLASYSATDKGLAEADGNEISDIFYGIWSNDDYGNACLNEEDANIVYALWDEAEDAYYDDAADDDPLMVIYNCLPNWAYEMREACWQITYCLKEIYDFVNGDSLYDSLEEIMQYNGQDFLKGVAFVNTYFPDIQF
ncbi:MAG: hypothetical protein K5930_05965 [Treponemataceae bacterium]|nr:hypothetical protein [Treponemataceae bacterium]